MLYWLNLGASQHVDDLLIRSQLKPDCVSADGERLPLLRAVLPYHSLDSRHRLRVRAGLRLRIRLARDCLLLVVRHLTLLLHMKVVHRMPEAVDGLFELHHAIHDVVLGFAQDVLSSHPRLHFHSRSAVALHAV